MLSGTASIRVRSGHQLSRLLSTRASTVLAALDIDTSEGSTVLGVYDGTWKGSGEVLESVCPTTGEVLARVRAASPQELQSALKKSREAYKFFRSVPAPRRGEILRQIREALAAKRDALGALISLEMGKIRTEGVGEVQEFVDIADYAVGLSRMMNGRVVASERPGHSILEVPNPLGVVAVLSAFNFPVAVYGWNLALSLAAGNATLWKPSPSTPLCSVAVTKIVSAVLEKNGIPGAVAGLVIGGKEVGEAVVESSDVDMEILCGGSPFAESELQSEMHGGNWVKPTVAIPTKVDLQDAIWSTETFAPVLCVGVFDELEEAIEWNNGVPQGLSSSLWTRDLRNLGKWIGPAGSDAGIVNVRKQHHSFVSICQTLDFRSTSEQVGQKLVLHLVGTRGRESGGDAWKQYVRWSACTINFSDEAPLAQGVNFSATA
ncbi:hypothetical protein PHLCEN_2v6275 [Hermanssonia centrifuga]|uniref:Aldehyde dehydrogenase domain-containing protein n=1 Tax=Hermanssonia centrifuga TaxID=98765 RepID=A0A2R6NZX2_9APHY|nr:hypothetical protein PHLCEN_2v6275 [Hermanssonia centrifuga]